MSCPSGKTSSEYEKVLRAEIGGGVLLAVGLIVAVTAAVLSLAVAAAVGVSLVACGAHLVAHSVTGYAASRGHVKAAALTKPAVHKVVASPSPRAL